MTVLWLIVLLVLASVAYVRLAPSDPADWHVAPEIEADRTLTDGVLRRVETGPDGLARFDAVAMAAPRTQRLAGSVADGMVTYIARTRYVGFPDYVTARQEGDVLMIHSRLRFGRSDLGVNAKRLDGWLGRL